jgi:hypothetical protein
MSLLPICGSSKSLVAAFSLNPRRILAVRSLRASFDLQLLTGIDFANPPIRQTITDGQVGIPLTLTMKVTDVNTCEPLINTNVDIWQANGTVSVHLCVSFSSNSDEGMVLKRPLPSSSRSNRSIHVVDLQPYATDCPPWPILHRRIRLRHLHDDLPGKSRPAYYPRSTSYQFHCKHKLRSTLAISSDLTPFS